MYKCISNVSVLQVFIQWEREDPPTPYISDQVHFNMQEHLSYNPFVVPRSNPRGPKFKKKTFSDTQTIA